MYIEASAIYSQYGHSLSHIPINQEYGIHNSHGLGSFFHIPKTHLPPDIIKVTKTVAVHVPRPVYIPVPHNIPYPVKVEVPRPYPVEVPKVVTVKEQVPVPVPVHVNSHQYGQTADYASINPVQNIQLQHQDAVQIQTQHDEGESTLDQSAYGHS